MKNVFKTKKYMFSNVYGSNITFYIVIALSSIITILLFILGFFSLIGVIQTNQLGLNGFDFLVLDVIEILCISLSFYLFLFFIL